MKKIASLIALSTTAITILAFAATLTFSRPLQCDLATASDGVSNDSRVPTAAPPQRIVVVEIDGGHSDVTAHWAND